MRQNLKYILLGILLGILLSMAMFYLIGNDDSSNRETIVIADAFSVRKKSDWSSIPELGSNDQLGTFSDSGFFQSNENLVYQFLRHEESENIFNSVLASRDNPVLIEAVEHYARDVKTKFGHVIINNKKYFPFHDAPLDKGIATKIILDKIEGDKALELILENRLPKQKEFKQIKKKVSISIDQPFRDVNPFINGFEIPLKKHSTTTFEDELLVLPDTLYFYFRTRLRGGKDSFTAKVSLNDTIIALVHELHVSLDTSFHFKKPATSFKFSDKELKK